MDWPDRSASAVVRLAAVPDVDDVDDTVVLQLLEAGSPLADAQAELWRSRILDPADIATASGCILLELFDDSSSSLVIEALQILLRSGR